MVAGLIQLASKNAADLYLTADPEVTFFKMVYKRYTNFSQELIPLIFNKEPSFGQQSVCKITNNGDLINKMYFSTILPSIPKLFDNVTGEEEKIIKYAWVKKIGYALIKSIELEIGGITIDRQFGEYLNLWYELSETVLKGTLDRLIGNISDLYDFSNGKDDYELIIPLKFWFCDNIGNSLPIIAINFNDIKINLAIEKIEILLRQSATSYIEIDENFCQFSENEIIYQNTSSNTIYNIFSHYDYNTKRMYYIKFNEDFTNSDSYKIYNDSGYFVTATGITVDNKKDIISIELSDSKLLVNYIFLDNAERYKFIVSDHEYLISLVSFQGESRISDNYFKVKVGFSQLCKQLFFVAQYSDISRGEIKDLYNYKNGISSSSLGLIKNTEFFLNSVARSSIFDYQYFSYLHPLYYCSNSPSEGINMFSFSLDPENNLPKGSCNFSEIENIHFVLEFNGDVSVEKQILFKIYSHEYNVLRISDGLCELAFSH